MPGSTAASGKRTACYSKTRTSSVCPCFSQLCDTFGLSERGRDALAHGTFADQMRRDFLNGVRSGRTGTPTFFINNLRYHGPASYEGLVATIAARLEYAVTPA